MDPKHRFPYKLAFGFLLFLLLFPDLLGQDFSRIGQKKLYYGVAYYPETWPEDQIEQDIELMKEVGVNVVHMAEFSWAKMEPVEGPSLNLNPYEVLLIEKE